MTELQLVLSLVVGWLVVGTATTALVMRRRGHRNPLWFGVGMALGPLFLPIALERRRRDTVVPDVPAKSPATSTGTTERLDVLVGVDGSPASETAVRTAVRLFGPRTDRLLLVRVLDYDHVGTRAARDPEPPADIARLLGPRGGMRPCWLEVVAGDPANALREVAEQEDVDVLVVGHHGRSRPAALLGSVAGSLARDCPRPVLVA